jgi:hypothetical protein
MSEENILTEEELQILEKLQKKLLGILDTTNKKDYEDALAFDSKEELVHPPKITDAPKEIIFVVKVIVTETNADHLPEKTIEVLEQNYHIPVPPGKSYDMYIDKFFDKFRSKLEETCQENK